MYRLKYYSLNKDEKKKLKNDFIKSEFGKNVNLRLNRVFIIGIIGLIFSIYLFFVRKIIWDLIPCISLFIFSIIFIIGSFKVRIKKLNEFLVSKKK